MAFKAYSIKESLFVNDLQLFQHVQIRSFNWL